MKLRIDKLADIDPLRVPLPHGTEVTTRVDRQTADRLIRRGAVGRVRAVEGEAVTVAIVGVGDVRYARSEVTPRKSGQLEFAIRREAAWQALRDTVVIETTVGSRAWGLSNENSDTDRRGLFVLPFPWTTALVDPPLDLVSADSSDTFWEVGKAFRQAVRADPNTLETLFIDDARATDPIGEWILADRDAFASGSIYGTFGRYALSQLKRLEQGMRLFEHRDQLLTWLTEDANLSLDAAAQRLADAAQLAGQNEKNRHLQAKAYIKQLYSSMFDQGLLSERNYAGLVAFAKDRSHEFEPPRELRPKNAYNLLRLLATATRWLREGHPSFVIEGPLRDELLAVKNQQVELRDVIRRAEQLAAELEDARGASVLPERPDVGRVDALLRRVRAEAARRHHEAVDGPFGKDAPELALATWTP